MEDVYKLDSIQDGFIHYQLLLFCQETASNSSMPWYNGHIELANQNVPQQQHVDYKIANTLLKKGIRDTYKAWNQQDYSQ